MSYRAGGWGANRLASLAVVTMAGRSGPSWAEESASTPRRRRCLGSGLHCPLHSARLPVRYDRNGARPGCGAANGVTGRVAKHGAAAFVVRPCGGQVGVAGRAAPRNYCNAAAARAPDRAIRLTHAMRAQIGRGLLIGVSKHHPQDGMPVVACRSIPPSPIAIRRPPIPEALRSAKDRASGDPRAKSHPSERQACLRPQRVSWPRWAHAPRCGQSRPVP